MFWNECICIKNLTSLNLLNPDIMIKHHDWVVNISALYVGGPIFKSKCGDWLSWQMFFIGFYEFLQANTEIVS
jgi:hypothetical protein